MTMKSTGSAFYFLILQVLWICRLIYETILPDNAKSAGKLVQQRSPEPVPGKRHLIHLFTTSRKEVNRRPVCYVHVCEIISPADEEMLRCACAKGVPRDAGRSPPPTQQISRETFTNVWMDTFSLVA